MAGVCCFVSECSDGDCLQLTERELVVCETICESEQPLRFSAIKRAVGLHQEILSRILRRLVTYGALERVQGRYRRKTGQ